MWDLSKTPLSGRTPHSLDCRDVGRSGEGTGVTGVPTRTGIWADRDRGAARTREAIVAAAKDVFERLGWSGTTMGAVADQGGVSVKTVEALYRTKAELLKV